MVQSWECRHHAFSVHTGLGIWVAGCNVRDLGARSLEENGAYHPKP